ncbi:MAG: hypothetical protein LBC37_03385, partial [Zoogloeaceae bacterium]|nr:hypothetical protein [Zoogloeaceae bacterium]
MHSDDERESQEPDADTKQAMLPVFGMPAAYTISRNAQNENGMARKNASIPPARWEQKKTK